MTWLLDELEDMRTDFNPHEREARDVNVWSKNCGGEILIHTSVKLVTSRYNRPWPPAIHFNPHEREARDCGRNGQGKSSILILIHTSVKLVTVEAG